MVFQRAFRACFAYVTKFHSIFNIYQWFTASQSKLTAAVSRSSYRKAATFNTATQPLKLTGNIQEWAQWSCRSICIFNYKRLKRLSEHTAVSTIADWLKVERYNSRTSWKGFRLNSFTDWLKKVCSNALNRNYLQAFRECGLGGKIKLSVYFLYQLKKILECLLC